MKQGHTIARHVAQTENNQETRRATRIPPRRPGRNARAGRKPYLPGFANRTAIAQWAGTALHRTQACLRLDQLGPGGSWVSSRATGQLAPMSKVRIVLQKKAIAGKHTTY